ncbi:MAG: hypothetical protein IT521_10310 [Burkholderiales bacterium]|nr:hypothetical protein [Burkholderiales bacterium]
MAHEWIASGIGSPQEAIRHRENFGHKPQYPEYLTKALRDCQSGARKNPIMDGMAQGLSAKDSEDVFAYFCVQPNNLATRY